MSEDNVVFQAATWLIPLVFSIVLHEIAHGWTALAFGDPTAKRKRRLTSTRSAMSIRSGR